MTDSTALPLPSRGQLRALRALHSLGAASVRGLSLHLGLSPTGAAQPLGVLRDLGCVALESAGWRVTPLGWQVLAALRRFSSVG